MHPENACGRVVPCRTISMRKANAPCRGRFFLKGAGIVKEIPTCTVRIAGLMAWVFMGMAVCAQTPARLTDLGAAAPAADPGAVTAFAAILDSLGRLRTRDASAAAFAAAAGGGEAAAAGPAEQPPSVRETLRSLSPDQRGWTLLTLSAAAALGLPVGLVSWQDTSFALVDTGIPRAEAVSEVPALARYRAVLEALSHGSTLCVPLSGAIPADTERAAGWAVADALQACAARDISKARLWWRAAVPGEVVRRPVPAAFPFCGEDHLLPGEASFPAAPS